MTTLVKEATASLRRNYLKDKPNGKTRHLKYNHVSEKRKKNLSLTINIKWKSTYLHIKSIKVIVTIPASNNIQYKTL